MTRHNPEPRSLPILFSAPMVRALLDGRKTQTRRILKPQPLMGYTPDVTASKGVRFAKGDRLWVRETWAQHHPAGVQAGRFSMAGRAGIPGPPCVTYRVIYRADGDPLRVWHCNDYPYRSAAGPRDEIDGRHPDVCSEFPGWDSPMCMPRWASRITLTVTDVRVQRLQEISEEDAIAEGCSATVGRTWWQGYRDLGYGGPLLHQTEYGDAPPDWMIEPKPAGRSTWEDRSAVQVYAALWDTINRPGSWNNNPWVIALTFTVERRNIDHAR